MAKDRWRLARRKPPDIPAKAITLMVLTALKDSSDAFPPLRSVTGAALHIWDLSQKVNANKEECRVLTERIQHVLEVLSDAVSDPMNMPPDLVDRIHAFKGLLEEMINFMEPLCRRKLWRRVANHREDASTISSFNRRLDDTITFVMLASTIKLDVSFASLVKSQDAQLDRSSESDSTICYNIHALALQVEHLQQQQRQLGFLGWTPRLSSPIVKQSDSILFSGAWITRVGE